jgi:hypothetical protein
MKNFCLLIAVYLIIIPNMVKAQVVESENKILLVNPDPDKRKITGVANPVNETDALNLEFFLNGNVHFGVATGTNDTVQLTVYPDPSAIVPGTAFSFLSPLTNDTRVYLRVNTIPGYFEITKKGTAQLDTADFVPNQFVTVIFDGIRFQVISELNRSCPIGFIKASEEYCIQPAENDSVFFWNAIKTCGDMNARVCSWGEWYYACQKSAILGMSGMLGNYEWVDGGGNSLGWTTPVTSDTGLMSGASTCIDITSSIVDTTHTHGKARAKPYRCCYSLRRND